MQVGGWPEGLGDDWETGVACGHRTVLIRVQPSRIGLSAINRLLGVEVCVKPGCKRPRCSDEPAVG
ncbi:hypothetical protein JGU66_19135 [Myxococcaceae bacterium JPH2]|nr:hypothetical protein [Myxococcaceae bacterium JPH2]